MSKKVIMKDQIMALSNRGVSSLKYHLYLRQPSLAHNLYSLKTFLVHFFEDDEW